jgi:predicted nucleic acid-binding protein
MLPRMRRVVLDSNALDPVIDDPSAYDVLREAVELGKLEMLRTHVNIDEVLDTPDSARRERLRRAWAKLTKPVPTGALALDTSKLNEARLTEDAEAVEALRSGNVKNTEDALIAVTALCEECALVTNEKKRLPNRAKERGIEVLKTHELLAEFGYPPSG